MIKFRVYGTPIPQGSARAFAVRKGGKPTGRVVVTGANAKTKSWRQSVVDAVEPGLGWAAMPGAALAVTLVFIMPRPASHLLTSRKSAGQVSPSAPAFPAARPDLDKLCRAVLDALTDAGVWHDDSQVASLNAAKVYAAAGEAPGVAIEVEAMA